MPIRARRRCALEETGEAVRPVCGYLLPDHLDGTLEFFDADGVAVGQVEPSPDGDGRAVWADAPGAPSLAGRPPSGVLADAHLGALADALVRWGVADAGREDEGALSALLRLVDSTLWTVDPFAHAGEEHMSLLVGHPIVVLRAALRLDLDDPLQPQDSLTTPVAVRLGALAAWQDGLLGFIVDDDPGTVHAASPAALRTGARGRAQPWLPRAGRARWREFHSAFADDLQPGTTPRSPITHPFVSPDPIVSVWPGHAVGLTLLVVPQGFVNATSGVLPRKEVGMRRQWIADALARIAPSFRFGPVLVDPLRIRMPVATELGGSWTWNHRRDVTRVDRRARDERRRRRADRRRRGRGGGGLAHAATACPGGQLVTGVLDRVLALVAGAVAPAITAEARNVLRFPAAAPAGDPAGRAGPHGGRADDGRVAAPARVRAARSGRDVPRDRGRAARRSTRRRRVPGGRPLRPATSWRGRSWSTTSITSPPATWVEHRVGLRLPLPIEIDVASGAWIVNADSMRALGGSVRRRLARAPHAAPRQLGSPIRCVGLPQRRRPCDRRHIPTRRRLGRSCRRACSAIRSRTCSWSSRRCAGSARAPDGGALAAGRHGRPPGGAAGRHERRQRDAAPPRRSCSRAAGGHRRPRGWLTRVALLDAALFAGAPGQRPGVAFTELPETPTS